MRTVRRAMGGGGGRRGRHARGERGSEICVNPKGRRSAARRGRQASPPSAARALGACDGSSDERMTMRCGAAKTRRGVARVTPAADLHRGKIRKRTACASLDLRRAVRSAHRAACAPHEPYVSPGAPECVLMAARRRRRAGGGRRRGAKRGPCILDEANIFLTWQREFWGSSAGRRRRAALHPVRALSPRTLVRESCGGQACVRERLAARGGGGEGEVSALAAARFFMWQPPRQFAARRAAAFTAGGLAWPSRRRV